MYSRHIYLPSSIKIPEIGRAISWLLDQQDKIANICERLNILLIEANTDSGLVLRWIENLAFDLKIFVLCDFQRAKENTSPSFLTSLFILHAVASSPHCYIIHWIILCDVIMFRMKAHSGKSIWIISIPPPCTHTNRIKKGISEFK